MPEREKKSLRKHYRALRARLDPRWIEATSAQLGDRLLSLPEMAAAKRVFIFVSMPGEPETRPIIRRLLSEGRQVFVPRCRPKGQLDLVGIGGLGDLAGGFFGIDEPAEGLPTAGPEEIDFAVLPALACGLDGSRLGQGGGYYDRFLSVFDGAYAAICFEEFLAGSLPVGAYDQPVRCIVSERRIITV